MLIPKMKIIRDEKHRRFIASLPCCNCGGDRVQAAHIRFQNGGGMGLKPCDSQCVPLCCDCHAKQHEIGEKKFWKNIEAAKALANALFIKSGDVEHGLLVVARFKRANL